MIPRRRILAAVPAAMAAPGIAAAQGAWPQRQIRLVVPYPPGGASDIAGRLQAQVLQDGLGVPVVVDNRGGAGGTLGTAHVAQSAPDGYTVMMASPSSHLGAPLLFRTPGYEGVDDFTAIATFSIGTALVGVNPRLPVQNIQELIAYARAQPGQLNFGSAGAGGANHMLGVLFMQRTGVELTHVPYRGAAPALADLIAGNIQLVFDSFAGIIPAVRGGQVRALAVTSAARWPLAPELPTVQEQGVSDYDLPSFSGVMGPQRHTGADRGAHECGDQRRAAEPGARGAPGGQREHSLPDHPGGVRGVDARAAHCLAGTGADDGAAAGVGVPGRRTGQDHAAWRHPSRVRQGAAPAGSARRERPRQALRLAWSIRPAAQDVTKALVEWPSWRDDPAPRGGPIIPRPPATTSRPRLAAAAAGSSRPAAPRAR